VHHRIDAGAVLRVNRDSGDVQLLTVRTGDGQRDEAGQHGLVEGDLELVVRNRPDGRVRAGLAVTSLVWADAGLAAKTAPATADRTRLRMTILLLMIIWSPGPPQTTKWT
jgi:hypothetical protein